LFNILTLAGQAVLTWKIDRRARIEQISCHWNPAIRPPGGERAGNFQVGRLCIYPKDLLSSQKRCNHM